MREVLETKRAAMSPKYLLEKGAETHTSPASDLFPRDLLRQRRLVCLPGEKTNVYYWQWDWRKRSKHTALVLLANVFLSHHTHHSLTPYFFFFHTIMLAERKDFLSACFFLVSLTSNRTWHVSGLQISCIESANVGGIATTF